ncbi:MAG TPA: META domain-containing protein [Bacteroidia bacterium]
MQNILYILLFFSCAAWGQIKEKTTTTLQNVDWKLVFIFDNQTKQKTVLDNLCKSTLRFNTDSTYRGRGCCNSAFSFTKNYSLKNQNGLSMTLDGQTKVGCGRERNNLDDLIFNSWANAIKYSIKEDTLVIYSNNNHDLFYVKSK